MASSKAVSSNGLAKKATAPACNAWARMASFPCAVRKIMGTGLARAQLPLELQAAKAWQPHIEEQTRRRVHLPRLEEGLRGGEGLGPPAHRAQETGEGVTDRLLIIDNRDQRGRSEERRVGKECRS